MTTWQTGVLMTVCLVGSVYSAERAVLSVGETIPDLVLRTATGQPFDLIEAVSNQPAVLVFYRGGWCPFCTLHLAKLQTIEPQLLTMGYQILAISPDLPEKLAEADGKHDYSYTLLSDSAMNAAKAFGLEFEVDVVTRGKYKDFGIDLEAASGETHHLLPVPAVFVVGTDGIVRFSHSNPDYKVRLEPEEILRAAQQAIAIFTQPVDQPQALLNEMLQKFVADGLVDYQGLRANSLPLTHYFLLAGRVPEAKFNSWTEPQQLAFLINLYNASTIQLILDHYPVSSIKEIGNVFKGPWDQPIVPLFGKTITLNELEHGIIRKQYNDPRVHMALVCAAKGCPILRSKVYTAEKLDAQLDEQSHSYLATPAGLVIDRKKGVASISSIFKWYGDDFASMPAFIEKQSGENLDGLKIRYLKYDWSLNER